MLRNKRVRKSVAWIGVLSKTRAISRLRYVKMQVINYIASRWD